MVKSHNFGKSSVLIIGSSQQNTWVNFADFYTKFSSLNISFFVHRYCRCFLENERESGYSDQQYSISLPFDCRCGNINQTVHIESTGTRVVDHLFAKAKVGEMELVRIIFIFVWMGTGSPLKQSRSSRFTLMWNLYRTFVRYLEFIGTYMCFSRGILQRV